MIKLWLLGFWAMQFALSPLVAQANSFGKSFALYTEARQLELELALLPFAAKSDELDINQKKNSLNIARREKLEAFSHSIQQIDPSMAARASDSLLRPLQKNGRRLASADTRSEKEILDFLSEQFPEPKKLSPFEWQCLREWFGAKIQESFLQLAFDISPAPFKNTEASPIDKIFIDAPIHKIASASGIGSPEISRWVKKNEFAITALEKADGSIKKMELSAFSKIDEQAEELARKLSENEEGYIFITSGDSSAIMLRALEAHPELLQSKKIRGWLNWNGRLLGISPPKIAIKNSISQANKIEFENIAEYYRLYRDNFAKSAPLRPSFPVINLISQSSEARPAENLREALIGEGRTYFVSQGDEKNAIRGAIQELSRKPGSLPWRENPRIIEPSF